MCSRRQSWDPQRNNCIRIAPAVSAKLHHLFRGGSLIVLALIFYSIGVWSERLAGRLKLQHVVCFWLGLVFDTIGTSMMMEMAGGLTADIHGVTGVAAILLNVPC